MKGNVTDSAKKQNRSSLSGQVWMGLSGILLMIAIPAIYRNVQMLIQFLALLILPLLIVLIMRWLKGKFGLDLTAALLYFPLSVSWIAMGIMGLTYGPPWIDILWIPQGIIGLWIAIGLLYNKGRTSPHFNIFPPFWFAVLGLRTVITYGTIPLISAVLSVAAVLYLGHFRAWQGAKTNLSRHFARVLFVLILLLMIPFPFQKSTILKLTERHKIARLNKFVEGKSANLRPVIVALDDPDGVIREKATWQLGLIAQKLRDAENSDLGMAIDALIPRLDDPITRQTAVSQLLAIGDAKAVSPLVGLLGKYPDMDNYPDSEIITTFGGGAAQLMIELLERSEGPEWREVRTRRRTILALGNYRDRRVAEAIAKHLGDKSSSVREAAIRSLSRMRRSEAMEALARSMNEQDVLTRRSAIETLARMRANIDSSPELTEAVNRAASGDEDLIVRKYATEVLGYSRSQRSVDTLISALGDEHQKIRDRAVRSLGNMGGEAGVDPLIAALSDERIRMDAAESLVKVGNPRGVEAALAVLIDDLKHGDPRAAASAARLLGNARDERCVAPLLESLRHEDISVRSAVAEALHQIGEPDALAQAREVMLKDLNDPDARVRTSAARVLGRIGDENVVPRLVHIARSDVNDSVRRSAISALAALDSVRMKYWVVIGPFDNTDGNGFNKQYPPEKETNLSGEYDGKEGKVHWKEYSSGDTDDLLPAFQPNQHVLAYALTYIASPDEKEAVFRLGSDDGVKLWVENALVWSNDIYRGMKMDSDNFSVKLGKGRNKLLMKITQGAQQWGFHLRITDENGIPFDDLEYLDPLTNQ